MTDFLSGNASIFTGDFSRDRQLLERTIEGILVYDDGSLVVQFRESSLFEPVRSAKVRMASPKSEEEGLAERRTGARSQYEDSLRVMTKAIGADAMKNIEGTVTLNQHGEPTVILGTPGILDHRRGGSKLRGEITLASPEGVELPCNSPRSVV